MITMPQLRTKLSERREIAHARKAIKRAEKLVGSLSPQELANLKAQCVGRTAPQVAVSLMRQMFAHMVREKMIKDDVGIPADMIEAITEHTVEDILSGMVEGDLILDDGPTHQAFRQMLDDLREKVSKIEGNLKSLSYDELLHYPTPSDLGPLAMTAQLDFGTGVRFNHIGHFGALLQEAGERSGINPETFTEEQSDILWRIAAFDTIAETLATSSCSVAQVAEAMSLAEEVVAEAWAAYKESAGVTELHPTPA
jgi:hypothetical protein